MAHQTFAYVLFHGACHWDALSKSQLMGSVASWRNVYYGLGSLNPKTPTTADPNGRPQDKPQQRIYESTDQMQTWHELNDAALIAKNIATADRSSRPMPGTS